MNVTCATCGAEHEIAEQTDDDLAEGVVWECSAVTGENEHGQPIYCRARNIVGGSVVVGDGESAVGGDERG